MRWSFLRHLHRASLPSYHVRIFISWGTLFYNFVHRYCTLTHLFLEGKYSFKKSVVLWYLSKENIQGYVATLENSFKVRTWWISLVGWTNLKKWFCWLSHHLHRAPKMDSVFTPLVNQVVVWMQSWTSQSNANIIMTTTHWNVNLFPLHGHTFSLRELHSIQINSENGRNNNEVNKYERVKETKSLQTKKTKMVMLLAMFDTKGERN